MATKKTVTRIIRSDSMDPLLQKGDGVFIEPVNKKALQVNDIIAMIVNHVVIYQRVLYIKDACIVVREDNNGHAMSINFEEIIGKVMIIKRNDQYLKIEDVYALHAQYYWNEIQGFYKKSHQGVILKGLPLHIYYEGIYPKRFYADCDILMRSKDSAIAESFLQKSGYRKSDLDILELPYEKKAQLEVTLYKYIDGFPVAFDLHKEPVFLMIQFDISNIFYSRKLLNQMTEMFIISSKKIKIHTLEFSILAPHNLIIYLALHFFHHNYQGIFRLSLIHAIIKKEANGMLWQDIIKTIDTYKLKNFIYPVFRLLQQYYETAIPSEAVTKTFSIKGWIMYHLLKKRVFDEDTRKKAGIIRFLLILFLSPVHWNKKIWVFLDIRMWKSFYWSMFLGNKAPYHNDNSAKNNSTDKP